MCSPVQSVAKPCCSALRAAAASNSGFARFASPIAKKPIFTYASPPPFSESVLCGRSPLDQAGIASPKKAELIVTTCSSPFE
jgi:hypothetical protein